MLFSREKKRHNRIGIACDIFHHKKYDASLGSIPQPCFCNELQAISGTFRHFQVNLGDLGGGRAKTLRETPVLSNKERIAHLKYFLGE